MDDSFWDEVLPKLKTDSFDVLVLSDAPNLNFVSFSVDLNVDVWLVVNGFPNAKLGDLGDSFWDAVLPKLKTDSFGTLALSDAPNLNFVSLLLDWFDFSFPLNLNVEVCLEVDGLPNAKPGDLDDSFWDAVLPKLKTDSFDVLVLSDAPNLNFVSVLLDWFDFSFSVDLNVDVWLEVDGLPNAKLGDLDDSFWDVVFPNPKRGFFGLFFSDVCS